MYKHLLVPVDESELSIANVGEAVKLARGFSAPAKLTFFHATADYAASSEGSRAKTRMQDKLHRVPLFSEGSSLTVREMNPDQFRDRVLGQSRALLAKACAAATAAQVACDTHTTIEVPVFRCGCGSTAVDVVGGEELLVTSLDLAGPRALAPPRS